MSKTNKKSRNGGMKEKPNKRKLPQEIWAPKRSDMERTFLLTSGIKTALSANG
jgi:hypothetical protein